MESIQKKPSRTASSSARDGGEGQVYGMGEMRELKVSIRSIGIYRRERTYLTYAVAMPERIHFFNHPIDGGCSHGYLGSIVQVGGSGHPSTWNI
jgi:hypothetical protein